MIGLCLKYWQSSERKLKIFMVVKPDWKLKLIAANILSNNLTREAKGYEALDKLDVDSLILLLEHKHPFIRTKELDYNKKRPKLTFSDAGLFQFG